MGDRLFVSLLGSKIQRLRLIRGLRINELAKRAKISASIISKIESGAQESLHPKTVRKLARAFRIPVRMLRALREENKITVSSKVARSWSLQGWRKIARA